MTNILIVCKNNKTFYELKELTKGKYDNSIAFFNSNIIQNINFQLSLTYDCIYIIKDYESIYDLKLIEKMYVGHPHIRIFDLDYYGFLDELNFIYKRIEKEKKFLIEYPNLKDLDKYIFNKCEIEQFYLEFDNNHSRLRKRTVNNFTQHFLTIKKRIDEYLTEEVESQIDIDFFDSMLTNAPDNCVYKLSKTRYCIIFEDNYFELDIYPFWNDKAIIEIELSSDRKIELPPIFKLIKDVTTDSNYKNYNLARINNDIN